MDFERFAAQIYLERKQAHEIPYLLPALYGGDLNSEEQYQAIVVLEAPSISFTEGRWYRAPNSAKDAVALHREIFFNWASGDPQRELFDILMNLAQEKPHSLPGALLQSSPAEFFDNFYITDIWKDAKKDKSYWASKLKIELHSVKAKFALFVGKSAQAYMHLVPDGLPEHPCHFPGAAAKKYWTPKYRDNLGNELYENFFKQK